MHQSRASIVGDLAAPGGPEGLADTMAQVTATLFIEVDYLDEVITVLGNDADVLAAAVRPSAA